MKAILIFLLLLAAIWLLFSHGVARGRWRSEAGSAWHSDEGRRPTPQSGAGIRDVPLLLELLAAASEAGMTLAGALGIVSEVASAEIRQPLRRVVAGLEMGASWEHSWAGAQGMGGAKTGSGTRGASEVERLREALSFSALTGASAAPLLYSEAAQIRRQNKREAEAKASALGVKLVIPLGLCSLPAFICLGIVPVVIAMIPAL